MFVYYDTERDPVYNRYRIGPAGISYFEKTSCPIPLCSSSIRNARYHFHVGYISNTIIYWILSSLGLAIPYRFILLLHCILDLLHKRVEVLRNLSVTLLKQISVTCTWLFGSNCNPRVTASIAPSKSPNASKALPFL